MLIARKFGIETRPDLEPGVVDELLKMFREKHPNVMERGHKNWWYFPESQETFVSIFLNNPENVTLAKAKSLSMVMYGSGRSRGRKEATVCVTTKDGEVEQLSIAEAEAAFVSLLEETARLTSKEEELTKENLRLKDEVEGLRLEYSLLQNIAVHRANQDRQIKEEQKSEDPALAGKAARAEKTNTSLGCLASFIFSNPDISLGCKTKSEAARKYAKAANAAGLSSPNGLPWSGGSINNHQSRISAVIDHLRELASSGQLAKPRVRVGARNAKFRRIRNANTPVPLERVSIAA